MPIIYTYPTVTPASSDLVLLSDVSASGKPTKTATASSIADLAVFDFEKTSLTTAQLKSLNTTPVTLVTAPGVGKVIVPISIVIKYNYAGAAMTVNDDLNIVQGSVAIYQWTNALAGVVSSMRLVSDDVTSDAILGENTALTIQVAGGNPTVGASTSTLDVYVYYKTLTL